MNSDFLSDSVACIGNQTKPKKTVTSKSSFNWDYLAFRFLYNKCWTVEAVMEVTSFKHFTLSFQSLQEHFWHSVLFFLRSIMAHRSGILTCWKAKWTDLNSFVL